MKRRKALQSLAAVTATIAYLPSCSVEQPIPTYSNLQLADDEYRLVRDLVKAILPRETTTPSADTEGTSDISTPESAEDFVLTMVNDCFDPMDIRRYLRGLRLFRQYVQDEYKQRFEQLNEYQHLLMLTEMSESENFPQSLQFFLGTTKNLAVRQFTSSEYFLKEKMEWEFIPGRYIGCVPA